jgi:hypothetical protein
MSVTAGQIQNIELISVGPRVETQQQIEVRKKRDALAKLDNAKFGWFHVRAIVVSGIGFYTVNMIFNNHYLIKKLA